MEINSTQGVNAYSASTSIEKTAPVQTPDRQAAEADLNRENTRPNQEAFEVTITQEARARQAVALQTSAQPLQAQPPESSETPDSTEQNQTTPRQQETPVVDIVA